RSIAGHVDLFSLGHGTCLPAADPGWRIVEAPPVAFGYDCRHHARTSRPRRICHGCRHAEVAKIRRPAFPRGAARPDGMAEDALPRLRGQDAVVRPEDRTGHRPD